MKVKVEFQKCIYDSLELGSSDREVVSLILCTMETKAEFFPEVTVEVRQPRGPRGLAEEPIEVAQPEGYSGPENQAAFAKAVKVYYKSLTGRALRIATKGKSVRMAKEIPVSGSAEFEA